MCSARERTKCGFSRLSAVLVTSVSQKSQKERAKSSWLQEAKGKNGSHMCLMPLLLGSKPMSQVTQEVVQRYHTHAIPPGRCGSVLVQDVTAPLPVVWSVVRRFDRPQAYKRFVRSCSLRAGDGGVGSVREVHVVSGLPAATSTERLDALDDARHLISFSIVGGDHRLANYRSTTTVHDEGGGSEGEGGKLSVVVESYEVDVPPGSTEEETCIFADTIIRCNLRSLAHVTEEMARSSSNS